MKSGALNRSTLHRLENPQNSPSSHPSLQVLLEALVNTLTSNFFRTLKLFLTHPCAKIQFWEKFLDFNLIAFEKIFPFYKKATPRKKSNHFKIEKKISRLQNFFSFSSFFCAANNVRMKKVIMVKSSTTAKDYKKQSPTLVDSLRKSSTPENS